MKFTLTKQEVMLLRDKDISFDDSKDYSEDEALNLLDAVREIEVSYAQFTGGKEAALFAQYGSLADKLYSQIPED